MRTTVGVWRCVLFWATRNPGHLLAHTPVEQLALTPLSTARAALGSFARDLDCHDGVSHQVEVPAGFTGDP